ncbi:beta-arabinofuranosyltransferase RAY1 isoform X2 [Abrus precatorius]|uniref:Beta-arabinofuranosyltransferase RAY1 isoform X2 n=1 Tax=Abrus precatorius TaxID=3816 RepID=A0A8B8KU62_ABRPR|nr:beta-arabinofuranosyltransferase RAY1 isoform X2 [Abrus precatorius]
MIEKSRSYTTEISVIIDPQTVILSGFLSTLNHVYELDHDWLLVASAQNVSYFPFHLDESGKHWQTDTGKQVKIQELQKILQHNSQWNHCYTRMLMAWNSKDMPLHNGVLPPFLFGKGIHNSWVIHEAMSSDAKDFENRNWEYIGNSHIGSHYGSFFYCEANYSSLVKLLKCNNQYIMVDTKKNMVYPIGQQGAINQMKERIFPSWLKENTMYCIDNLKSETRSLDCSLKNHMKIQATLELQFSLESLLSFTADKTKTIILTIAGYSYKDMLMSWVCRLRKLSIENFIVCALDQETYQFSILQGIPVFNDPIAPSNISFDDCHFGSKCFQRVTKVKSRIVLKILKLGYNVLLSDVDVYWFRSPVHLLHSFGPAVLAAQSDEFQNEGPINLPRRLNSGFYYAHSDIQTIAAIEKVVRHAETSGLSEQPSFYDTLCGKGGSNRVGDNKCVEPETNLTVHFLDRDLFPNGAYQDLWQEKNVKEACLKKRCYIIHNNWISGRLKKLERQVLSGLWEYDPGTRMCMQSWHSIKP